MNKRIWRLALPNIISNLTVPLVGLVDTWLMGHLSDSVYIGAIILGSMIFLFIYAGLGFLRMGTTGFTAQSFGARNFPGSIAVLTRALLIGTTLALILLAGQDLIAWLSFGMIHGSPLAESLAKEYFFIRIWAAPATLGVYIFSGWFIGMQNARFPMIIAIIVNLVNIAASSVLILYFDMKSEGAAWGTVLAQYSGLLVSVVLFHRYYSRLYKYYQRKLVMQWTAFKGFVKVNTDILIRSLLLTGTFFYFTAESARFGDDILSLNSLILQFLWILSYLIDGLAFAAEALIGQAIGSRNKAVLLKTVKLIFMWGSIIIVPITAIYILGNDFILSLLTDNDDLLMLSKEYEFWIWLIPLLTFAAFVWDGIYIGATAGKAMRNSMIVAVIFVFIPVYYLSRSWLGNHSLWLSLMLFMVARSLTLAFLFQKSVVQKSVKV